MNRDFEDRGALARRGTPRACAEGFIEQLPEGYHTQLGKWFLNGRELSGGQWQKVALSRAFMRDRADILVLDEPTAAMDAAGRGRGV
jgi:ATP-binding cassette subfamily B protein